MSSKKRRRRPRGAVRPASTPAIGASVADAELQQPPAAVEELPPAGVAYPLTLRGPGFAWWRSLLGIATAILLYLVVTSTVSSLVIGIGYLVQRRPQTAAEYAAAGYRFELPAGMLAQNLAIAALTLVAWFVITVVHHVRPRWLSSVQPGIRWRYLLLCLGAAVLLLNSVALLANLLSDGSVTVRPQPQLLGFLVVIIVTSPLQAAAEEYLFRGYLLQALGSLVTNPWFGVVVSAILFAYLHGGQNLPLFLNRLAFGLLAAVLVLKTGGLEAGIAAHIVNNVSAYTIASLTSSIAALRAVDEIGWLDSSVNILGFALFTLAAIWIGRRLQLNITTPAIVKDTP